MDERIGEVYHRVLGLWRYMYNDTNIVCQFEAPGTNPSLLMTFFVCPCDGQQKWRRALVSYYNGISIDTAPQERHATHARNADILVTGSRSLRPPLPG